MTQATIIHPLESFQTWAQKRSEEIYFSQPVDGVMHDLTWAQVSDQVRRMAAYLKSVGFDPGSRIAILAKNSAWWTMADLAIMMAGHVSVPIYPSLSGASVRYILEHSQAKALFLGKLESDDWDSMRKGIPEGVVALRMPLAAHGELPGMHLAEWSQIMDITAPLRGFIERGSDELATIVYTSGTTGEPKGVMHSFRTLGICTAMIIKAYGFSPQDRLFSYLPSAHIADRLLIQLASIGCGCRVTFNESIETFVLEVQRVQPTFFISVPRLWTKFRQAVNAKLPQLALAQMLADPVKGPVVRKQVLTQLGLDQVRYALSGGAPLPPDLHQWYLDLGLELLEIYGMTENLGVSHGSRSGQGRVGYVGQARDGVEVKLADDTGEVLVKSDGCMVGYFQNPGATAEAITADGFMRTGDVGTIDGDGYLKITGRAREAFKTSKGKFVQPAQIENALNAHPLVEASCVTGMGFPQPFAMVVLASSAQRGSDDLTQSMQSLMDAVNEKLDPHERLAFLVMVNEPWTVENGILTPTLKLKRSVLEGRFKSDFNRWAELNQTVVWLH